MSATGAPRRVALRLRGHPAVRATHAKTLELTTEPTITARATCVVGIAAPGAFAALAGLRGPITITLRAGSTSDRVHAVANPAFDGGSRAVVRRSGRRSPETLAVGADKAAADLDRDLAAALVNPDVQVEVEVEADAGEPAASAALLVVPAGAVATLAAGSAPAAFRGVLVVFDPDGAPHGAALAERAGLRHVTGEAALGEVAERLGRGEAVAVVCDLGRPGGAVARVLEDAARSGVAVRAVGDVEPSAAALVATGLIGIPRALPGRPPAARAARGAQLRAVAALGAAGAWDGPLAGLVPLLDDLASWRPGTPAGVLLDPGGFAEELLRGPAAELAGLAARGPGRVPAVAVADLRGAHEPGEPGLDGAVPDVLAALLDEGVTPRTLARALQRLPGVGGRQGYEVVLGVKREREERGGAAGPDGPRGS